MKKIILLIFLLPQLGFAQMTTVFDTVFAEDDATKIQEVMKSEGMMKDGFQIGVWKKWYSNGQLSDSCEYAVISKNKIKLYDEDSSFYEVDTNYIRKSLKEKYSFPIGEQVSYYRNGKKKETGNYLPLGIVKIKVLAMPDGNGDFKDVYVFSEPEGMKTGIWRSFDDKGNVESKDKYINGVYVGDAP
jgi:antitoxin component YwqK of YwqJK toxin-antitoxin module